MDRQRAKGSNNFITCKGVLELSSEISCQVCQKMFHLPGKSPISRQVCQNFQHLTGCGPCGATRVGLREDASLCGASWGQCRWGVAALGRMRGTR